MSPTQKGSFCKSCHKEVFDFTYKTDFQILETLSQNQNTCGRFMPEQLNRPITFRDPSILLQGFKRITTTLLSLVALYRVHASDLDQSPAQPKVLTHQKDSVSEPFILGDVAASMYDTTVFSISGYVVDRLNQHPIRDATVKLIGTSLSVRTDVHGYFKIDTMFVSEQTEPFLPIKLLFKCQHYDAKYLSVDSPLGLIHASLNPKFYEGNVEQIVTMGFFTTPKESSYPSFRETFNYIFFRGNKIDTLPAVNTHHNFHKEKPLPPPLSERLIAWVDNRRKLFSTWIHQYY